MPADAPCKPICCDFHDMLEATTTHGSVARIEYMDEAGLRVRNTRIVDLATRADGEYMMLGSGGSVRFDRIVSVDSARLAAFADPGGDCGPA